MSLRVWETLRTESLLRIDPWVRVERETILLPDGRTVDDYYAVHLPDFVVVVALTQSRHVIVERHYKHGPRRVTMGLPAGYLRDGEAPELAAARELREETGYTAEAWRKLGVLVADGNRGCGTGHFFLAEGCRQTAQPCSGDLEEMEVNVVTVDHLKKGLASGEPHEMCTAAAIGLLELRDAANGG